MVETIKVEKRGNVCLLTLCRPEKKNALTQEMYQALDEALSASSTDASVHVTLITGTEGNFTSGNDLKEFLKSKDTAALAPVVHFLETLAAYPKPLIAAVSGNAIGIGTTLLLHCDLVFAAEQTRFQLPFLHLGLTPEGGSSYLLPRLMGHVRSSAILYLGAPFDSQTAKEQGLINQVAPTPEATFDAALQAAEQIALLSPQAVLHTKRLLKAPLTEALSKTLVQEATCFAKQLQSAQTQAILQKRLSN